MIHHYFTCKYKFLIKNYFPIVLNERYIGTFKQNFKITIEIVFINIFVIIEECESYN